MFPQVMRERRDALGISQTELAYRAGVQLMTISELESGKRNIRKSRLETFCALCRALGLLPSQHIDDICEGADTPQP